VRTRLAHAEPDLETCDVAKTSAVLSPTVIADWLMRNRNPTVGSQVARLGLTSIFSLAVRSVAGSWTRRTASSSFVAPAGKEQPTV